MGFARVHRYSNLEPDRHCHGHAGEVIADGQDCTSRHPLKHALMVAIDAAAARDRRLWPSKSQDADSAGVNKSNHAQADTEAANANSSIAVSDVHAPGDVCTRQSLPVSLPPPRTLFGSDTCSMAVQHLTDSNDMILALIFVMMIIFNTMSFTTTSSKS